MIIPKLESTVLQNNSVLSADMGICSPGEEMIPSLAARGRSQSKQACLKKKSSEYVDRVRQTNSSEMKMGLGAVGVAQW